MRTVWPKGLRGSLLKNSDGTNSQYNFGFLAIATMRCVQLNPSLANVTERGSLSELSVQSDFLVAL